MALAPNCKSRRCASREDNPSTRVPRCAGNASIRSCGSPATGTETPVPRRSLALTLGVRVGDIGESLLSVVEHRLRCEQPSQGSAQHPLGLLAVVATELLRQFAEPDMRLLHA